MLAATPEPPYTAVIFSALPAADQAGYEETLSVVRALAAQQPGFLGIESAGSGRPAELEVTVSYWATEDDARAWKAVAEHVAAQRRGRDQWYDRYRVRVATVAREYGTE